MARLPDGPYKSQVSSSTPDGFVAELQDWIHEAGPSNGQYFAELGNRLQFYRGLLATHLAKEESLDRLRQVGKFHPECQSEIGVLHRQHGQFLDELDTMVTKLHQEEPPYDSWQEAIRQFEELLTEIHRHEGREGQLLACVMEAHS